MSGYSISRWPSKAIIRPDPRQVNCPKCGEKFFYMDDYLCSNCMTSPNRFLVDFHFKGRRIRIFCDRQGKPLDTFDRALDLSSDIEYEVKNHRFDPSRYIKAEQIHFYVLTQLDHYAEYKVDTLAPSYQADFKRHIKMAKDFFGGKDLREIKKGDLIGFKRHLESNFKLSGKTIKNIMDTFKAFLNYLKNDLELINVVPKFPDLDVEIRPIRWFSQEDQITVYESIPDLFKDVIAFLILHGCRPSEARALKCKNVELSMKTITISATFSGSVYREKRKGKRSRPITVPIHPESYPFISYRVKNNLPEAFLFVNAITGRPFNKNALQRMWSRVRKKMGFEKEVRLYDFTRHSFVTNHLNSGTSIWKVSKLVGHSGVNITDKKYGHLDVESLRVDSEKLSLRRHQDVIKEFASA